MLNRPQRWFGLAGIGCVVACSSLFASANAVSAQLRDIGSYWGRQYISSLVERDIVSGFPNDTFRPNDKITRAQFAAVVAKAFELDVDVEPTTFSDSLPEWAAPSIHAAAAADIIAGYPDGSFRPDDPLTRAQAISILTKVTGVPKVTEARVDNILSRFDDRDSIPSWANESVATATYESLLILFPEANNLNPEDNVTRGDVAALTYLALIKVGKAEPMSIPAGATIPNLESGKAIEQPTSAL